MTNKKKCDISKLKATQYQLYRGNSLVIIKIINQIPENADS